MDRIEAAKIIANTDTKRMMDELTRLEIDIRKMPDDQANRVLARIALDLHYKDKEKEK